MHRLRAEHLLDPQVVIVLQEVARIARECDTGYLVVGATARDILLTHVFGMPLRRATYDLDFAIAVENWERFEQIVSRLKSAGFDAAAEPRHRLYFPDQGHGKAYPVDLVPFRGIAQKDGSVAWPPDMAVIMNVVGYREALDAAEQVEIAPDLIVNVASLPGLAILKLFAWLDRGLANPKDAHDLHQLMRTYADAGNMDRLYETEYAILEAADHDPELGGACLLGKDAAHLASPQTYAQLVSILENETERLTTDMLRSLGHMEEDARIKVERRLQHFKTAWQCEGRIRGSMQALSTPAVALR